MNVNASAAENEARILKAMAHCQSSVIIVNESFATLCDGNPWLIKRKQEHGMSSMNRLKWFAAFVRIAKDRETRQTRVKEVGGRWRQEREFTNINIFFSLISICCRFIKVQLNLNHPSK